MHGDKLTNVRGEQWPGEERERILLDAHNRQQYAIRDIYNANMPHIYIMLILIDLECSRAVCAFHILLTEDGP
jgi:hypothetical protein